MNSKTKTKPNKELVGFPYLCSLLRGPISRQQITGSPGSLETDMRTGAITINRKDLSLNDGVIGSFKERLALNFKDYEGNPLSVSIKTIIEAISVVAEENKFHPVQQYLNSLVWDGNERLCHVGSKLLGAEDSSLNKILIRKWFISAVARTLAPGCKVDTVFILVGEQGAKKSTFFSVLGGEYYCDSLTDISNKDSLMILGSSWINEWAELETMTRARDQNSLKGFITRRIDVYRPPYGKSPISCKRSSVFVGTSNNKEILSDETGGRRYWTIKNGTIDIELTKDWRDQLWAEAVVLYKQGEIWWLIEEEEIPLKEAAEDFLVDGVWDEQIENYLKDPTEKREDGTFTEKGPVTIDKILTFLKVPLANRTMAHLKLVGKTLRSLGWEKLPRTRKSGRQYIWGKVE